jgi:O-acetyl-ADP-ribose deacetylase (regulator of RNase III)
VCCENVDAVDLVRYGRPMHEVMSGDLFASKATVLVNPVNCVGVSGAGLAKLFAKRFPSAQREYERYCNEGRLKPGVLFVQPPLPLDRSGGKTVIYFPTKRHWKESSNIRDLSMGLAELRREIVSSEYRHVAVPALGCGLGGLDWDEVRPIMETYLKGLRARVDIYAPWEAT